MREENNIGSSVGIIIVILILVIGGIYFFGQRIQKQKELQQQNVATDTTKEVTDVQSDASSMNFDNLGNGIDQL